MPLDSSKFPLILATEVVGLHSRGSGLLMTTEGKITDADGTVYATTTEGTFMRMQVTKRTRSLSGFGIVFTRSFLCHPLFTSQLCSDHLHALGYVQITPQTL